MGTSSTNGRPCKCCFSLFKLIFSLGVTVLVFWLIYRPTKPKAYVESASLSQFNLNNNSLTYNLKLNITIRNPNRRVGFYYDSIEARAIYGGLDFGFDSLPNFYQGHKNTALLGPEFKGKVLVGGPLDSGAFEREKKEGWFFVEVKLYTKVRMKIMFIKIGHFKPKIDCVVKLAVPSNKSSIAVPFENTRCHFDL